MNFYIFIENKKKYDIYMILYNIPYELKLRISSFYIIEYIKEKLNDEIISYHRKLIVKKILDEIINNVLTDMYLI